MARISWSQPHLSCALHDYAQPQRKSNGSGLFDGLRDGKSNGSGLFDGLRDDRLAAVGFGFRVPARRLRLGRHAQGPPGLSRRRPTIGSSWRRRRWSGSTWLGQDQGGLKLRVLADDFEVVSALERVRLYPTSVTLFVSLSNPFVLISAKNCSVGQSQNAENRVI